MYCDCKTIFLLMNKIILRQINRQLPSIRRPFFGRSVHLRVYTYLHSRYIMIVYRTTFVTSNKRRQPCAIYSLIMYYVKNYTNGMITRLCENIYRFEIFYILYKEESIESTSLKKPMNSH